MWYFSWVLGVGFAVLLAVMNAMWNEAQEDRAAITGGDAWRQRLFQRTRTCRKMTVLCAADAR